MAPRPRADSSAVARRLALLSAELTGTPPHDDLPFPERPPVDLPPPEAARHERPPPTRVRPGARPVGLPPPQLVPALPAPGPPEERGSPVTTSVPTPGRHARRRALGPLAAPVALFPGPLAVVAVVVALGVLATGWWLLRSRPEPVAPPRPVAAGLATPAVGSGAAAAAGGAAQEVVVHVAGRVREPGLYTLQAGARVADALAKAGGARPRVDLSSLNLARPLVDGEQLLVGVPAGVPPAAAGPAGPAGAPGGAGLVNLNTADAATLEQLPGVGPVTAASIIAFREESGGFTSVDQLLDVSGIGEATLAEIAPHATV